MRILTIGSGGREHALVWALRKTSTRPLEIFCAPGNAGIAQDAECLPAAATDIPALIQLVEEKKIDLTVVGPEAPLALGIVDEFNRRDLRIVGPESQAARLESSKAFAKDFMLRHRVPTARHRIAESFDEASAILESGRTGPQMSISSHMDSESWDRKVEELSHIVAGIHDALPDKAIACD